MNIKKTLTKFYQPLIKTEEEYIFQKKMIKNDSPIIFDVGANVGQTTSKFLNTFNNPKVHAFEPFVEVAKKYKENHGNNKNVTLNTFALSNKKGKSVFYLNKCHYTNSILPSSKSQHRLDSKDASSYETQKTIQIQTETVDNYCKDKKINFIDILKMDTQGSEYKILEGASKMLCKQKISLIYTEICFVDLYQKQGLFSDINKIMVEYDYRLYNFFNLYVSDDFRLMTADAIFLSNDLANLNA